MPHTIVFFHAHPDDEAIATSGTMAKAKDSGHRVVLVLATGGELGETPDDLAPGETLAARRRAETNTSASIIGIDRLEFLGYRDSGMEDDPRINDPETFHSAALDEAAERLAGLLRAEQATVLVGYDERGNYLHPDHVKVHHVARRAAELAGTPMHYEATMNRDHIWNLMNNRRKELEDSGLSEQVGGEIETIEEFNLGMREWTVTHRIDVHDYVDIKRAAMTAHASQIGETSFFLQMPLDAFTEAFGYEWFIQPNAPRDRDAPFADDLFASLTAHSPN